MIEEGKRHRFDPPVQATGIQGEGNATKQFSNLRFAIGECVKVGTHAHEFRGESGGKIYKFFAAAGAGGSKFTPIT